MAIDESDETRQPAVEHALDDRAAPSSCTGIALVDRAAREEVVDADRAVSPRRRCRRRRSLLPLDALEVVDQPIEKLRRCDTLHDRVSNVINSTDVLIDGLCHGHQSLLLRASAPLLGLFLLGLALRALRGVDPLLGFVARTHNGDPFDLVIRHGQSDADELVIRCLARSFSPHQVALVVAITVIAAVNGQRVDSDEHRLADSRVRDLDRPSARGLTLALYGRSAQHAVTRTRRPGRRPAGRRAPTQVPPPATRFGTPPPMELRPRPRRLLSPRWRRPNS